MKNDHRSLQEWLDDGTGMVTEPLEGGCAELSSSRWDSLTGVLRNSYDTIAKTPCTLCALQKWLRQCRSMQVSLKPIREVLRHDGFKYLESASVALPVPQEQVGRWKEPVQAEMFPA